MTTAEPRAAVIDIRVLDARTGRMRSLDDSVVEHLQAIQLEEEVGLAPTVTLTFLAWDAFRGFVLATDAEFLWPGTEFELWSGFDAVDHCHGLFSVVTRDSDYPAGEAPTLSVQAHGSLARLMVPQQSFVFEALKSELPPLQAIAERAGMQLEAAEALSGPGVPKGDRVKEVGKSDLEYCKLLAQTYGLAMPRVAYEPSPSGSRGRETLEMLPLRVADSPLSGSGRVRFSAGQGRRLRYIAPESETGGELQSFDTTFDTQGLPSAVEVVGLDRSTRQVVRVTVRMTPTGAVVESEEQLDAKQVAAAADQLRLYSKFDPSAISDGTSFLVAQLGESSEGVETGKSYKTIPAGKRRRITVREKRWAREVLYAGAAQAGEGVREYALAWMQARYEGFFVCSGELVPNIQGAHELGVDQAHYVSGVLPTDEGYYLMTRVTHSWDGSGHQVRFEGQRVLVEAR
jgi:hypothetical protein